MYIAQWLKYDGKIPLSQLLEDAFAIREAVFVQEQGFSHDLEFDATDEEAWHLVLYDESRSPLATGRLYEDKERAGLWHLGRIAVRKEARGGGLGRLALLEMEKMAEFLDAGQLVLSAQQQARGFYEKLGYHPVGEEYLDEFCPHIQMEKRCKPSEDGQIIPKTERSEARCS